MKKIFIIIITGILILGAFRFYSMSIEDKKPEPLTVKEQLIQLASKNPQIIYDAFFSLDEFRPFSIVQFDKISDNYDKQWKEPVTLANMLNPQEKATLLDRITAFIESSKTTERQKELLKKLQYWCFAQTHFNLIMDSFGVPQDSLTTAALNTNIAKSIVIQYLNQHSTNYKKLTPEEFKMAYNDILNLVSSLKPRDQFAFYAKFYTELSYIDGY